MSMTKNINQSYGASSESERPLAVVPLVGSIVKVEIFDSANKSYGSTTVDRHGNWSKSIEVPAGQYSVQFSGGYFRPAGKKFSGQFAKPTRQQTIIITVTIPDDTLTSDQITNLFEEINTQITNIENNQQSISSEISTINTEITNIHTEITNEAEERERTDNQLTKASINFLVESSGNIGPGSKSFISIPYDCTIKNWVLLADQAGSVIIDVWKENYSNSPPISASSSIVGTKPSLSNQIRASGNATDWTSAISAGDVLRINVDSINSISRLSFSVVIEKSISQ